MHLNTVKVDMSHFKLTQKQKDLLLQLSKYDIRIKQAHQGAIYAIQQEEYPDRLAHFAYSLRDTIDLLTRSNQTGRERSKSLDKKERKSLLQSVIDPLGKQAYAYDDEYKRLVDEYAELSTTAHSKKMISDEQARNKLSAVEDILYMFTTSQLAINEEIDEIVLRPPSAEDAQRLVEMQFRAATQSVLLKKLPEDWLPYMINAGFFKDPQPTVFANGHPNYVNWTPSQYLIKCVNAFPKEVMGIIISCVFKNTKERNPSVYIDFLTCALSLPIDYVEKIGQKMLDEQWHDFIKNHWFAEKYIETMEKIYFNERYDIAIKLARHAFAPKLQTSRLPVPDSQNKWINDKNVTSPFDDYLFEKTLRDKIPKLMQKNPAVITKLIATLLEEYIELGNQGKEIDDKYNDRSDMWRSAIEESTQNWQLDTSSILVTHLRHCLWHIGNDDVQKLKDIMSIIHQKDYLIYRRLELYIYTQFSHAFKHEIRMSILWYFGNTYMHHEYYHLIKTVFSTLPAHIKQRIFESIDSGLKPEEFERIKNEYGENVAKKREKKWKIDHFEPIKDDLDEKHRRIYSKLVGELGVPEHPDYLSYHTASIGQPAIEPDLFKDKTVNQVFEIVKNYTIPNKSFAFDDITVATFREYVENNPLECSKKSSELELSDATIQYALFSGLGHAVEKGKDIEWEGVLPLIEYVVLSVPNSKNYTLKFYDPVQSIYSLMDDGFKKDSIGFQLKDRVWKVVKSLVGIGTHVQEPEGYPNNETNSLDMSLNNINGMSFHVVYQYAVWCERHGNTKRILVPEAKQVFEDYLNKKLEGHTVSRHAVLGVFFPNFYYLDQRWIKNTLEKIHSGKNEWIAFWDGYVSWNKLYRYVFDDLYKWYNKFLNDGGLIRNRKLEQPYNFTIDHTMLAYFYGLDNADSLVEKFLSDADELAGKGDEDKLSIGHCVHHIGMIIKDKDGDPKFNKEKLIKMWKRPSVLQHDLDRWFRDSPLDKKTSISLYLNYIKGYQKKFNLIYASIDAFSSYVEDFPQEVADCLEILIDKRLNNSIPEEKIRDVLTSLRAIGDRQINAKCSMIIENMALLGYDRKDLLDD